jgi:hypothetical protein
MRLPHASIHSEAFSSAGNLEGDPIFLFTWGSRNHERRFEGIFRRLPGCILVRQPSRSL